MVIHLKAPEEEGYEDSCKAYEAEVEKVCSGKDFLAEKPKKRKLN